jgi:hypothetical protein
MLPRKPSDVGAPLKLEAFVASLLPSKYEIDPRVSNMSFPQQFTVASCKMTHVPLSDAATSTAVVAGFRAVNAST